MRERWSSVKKHFEEHKEAYIAGSIAAVGACVLTYLSVKREPAEINQSLSFLPRAQVTYATIELVERSTPSRPVHLVGTDRYFNSLSEASRETGHDLSKLSQHVNGKIPDLNGDVFEPIKPTY